MCSAASNAGHHGVVAALDARHVEEAGAAADQHAARERDARHRLPAAFADGARAVAEALAAREGVANERMRLEALEFLERRQIRVGVVQMHDEADRHQIVAEVIDERAAAGCVVERPADGVLDEAGPVLLRRDLPEFLDADAVCLRVAVLRQPEARDQPLGEAAARAFGEHRVFAAQFHAAGEARLVVAVLADAHVAGGDAGDRAVVEQHLGGGKARIDFDAERFGLRCQPAADVAERDDVIAVVVHKRRHQRVRQPHRAGRPEHIEAVVGDGRLERSVSSLAPVRNEHVEPERIDHRAGQDMGADLAALFDDDDRGVRRELFEADRGGKARRPGADDRRRRIPSPRAPAIPVSS